MAEHALLSTDVAASVTPTIIPGHANLKYYTVDGRWRYAGPYSGGPNNGAALTPVISVHEELLAASVSHVIFIADGAYKVVGATEIHSVVGSTSAAVTVEVDTGTTAPGSGTAMHSTAFDLTATVNTLQTATITATAAQATLAAGNCVALKFAGTLTGLVGCVTVQLIAL